MFSITSVPFLKIRQVERSLEDYPEMTFKKVKLFNGRSEKIGATTIIMDSFSVPCSKEVAEAEIDFFCGNYGMHWAAKEPGQEYENFNICFRNPESNSKTLLEKVFAHAADIRKMWSFLSCSENFEAVKSVSTGEKAEFYQKQSEDFRKVADEIMSKLKSEGIATDEQMYTPEYMYIFPEYRMKEIYYKLARDYQVNWITPNACIAENDVLFETYCKICSGKN